MTQPKESILDRFGMALPPKPDKVFPTDKGKLCIYRYEDTEVVVPEAQNDRVHHPSVNKALLDAVNMAHEMNEYLNEPLSLFDTRHGTDAIERFRGLSLVRVADRALLEDELITDPKKRHKIAGVFGKSAVMLCNWSSKNYSQMIEELALTPYPPEAYQRIPLLKHN